MDNCTYCGGRLDLVTGAEIYKNHTHLAQTDYLKCFPCDAYVEVSPITMKPIGRFADTLLRKLRREATIAYNNLWKQGHASKKDVNQLIQDKISGDFFSIRLLGKEDCRVIIKACENYRNEQLR